MQERIQFLDNFKAVDVGVWMGKHLSFIPNLGITHGDHLRNSGGAPMLDELVFDYPDKKPDAEL